MKLNARQVETARPKDKPYKLADGGGLYLMVNPSGSRYWRLKYRVAGKEKLLALGVYPNVTLANARMKRDEAKRGIAGGIDPNTAKREEKLAREAVVKNTFQEIASEWHTERKKKWSAGYASDILEAFQKDIFPFIGKRPITDIKPLDLLNTLKHIEKRGATEKARKVRQWCGEVWKYAIVTARADYNPAPDLSVAMERHESSHFPHLEVSEMHDFYRSLSKAQSSKQVILALRLIIIVGLRPIELRAAPWTEIDFENALWEIPKERMKKRRPHLVPLSRQAIEILRQLKEISGWSSLIFPGRNNPNVPMSEGAINQLIRRIGYKDRACGHGFRHTMSTALYEHGYSSDLVETQLAHVDKNSIRGTYNHAQYLDGRREMLQWYADYMDSLERARM